MTYSLLAKDNITGAIGAVAATGSYCVGSWVLRGKFGVGLSASQGASPSTYWGEAVLAELDKGLMPKESIELVTKNDKGRSFRQLSAIDMKGNGANFTGLENTPIMSSQIFENGVACGNMLKNKNVIQSMVRTFLNNTKDSFEERLLAALYAAEKEGGDIRGVKSAAMLVLFPDLPPMKLHIDADNKPIQALEKLLGLVSKGDYAKWMINVPNPSDPMRFPK